MSQVKPTSMSNQSPARVVPSAVWALLLIPVVAALLIAGILDARRGPDAARAAADPLLAAAMVEFRAGERVAPVLARDPLLASDMVEFRAGERVSSALARDPLLAPAIVEIPSRRAIRLRSPEVGHGDYRPPRSAAAADAEWLQPL